MVNVPFVSRRVGGADMYLRVQGKNLDSARGEMGRLESEGQKALIAEHERIAKTAQFRVARLTVNNYKRPTVSSGRLEKATLKRGNIAATAFYVGVGNPAHLARSQVKYWRTIEEGSAATWTKRSFLSLPLRGTFGQTYRPGGAGPKYSTPRGNGGPPVGTGKFQPTGKYWRSTETGKSHFMPVFHPGHEIAPKNAYLQVFQEKNWSSSNIIAAQRHIDRIINGTGAIIAGKDFKPPSA